MKGILEGLLYVEGDQGLTIEEASNILEIPEEEAKELMKEKGIDMDKVVVHAPYIIKWKVLASSKSIRA